MADTVLEQTRALHEDLERLERVIVKDLKQDMKSHKDKLMQSHRVRKRLDGMQEAARKLVKIYEDEDDARKEDIAALAGVGGNPFGAFYERLKEVRDYYRRFPSTDITEAENDEPLIKEEPHVEFTGEESLGRFLDLHEHYNRFINGKFDRTSEKAGAKAAKLEYYEYAGGAFVYKLNEVPRQRRMSQAYRDYLQQLVEYLMSYHRRTKPLVLMDRIMKSVEEKTAAAFEEGKAEGWEDRGMGQASSNGAGSIDLDEFDTVEELEAVGAERLKEALQAMGLKCGGTPKDRAERLYLTKTTPLDRIDKKHFARGVLPPAVAASSEEHARRHQQAALQVATLESKVRKFAEMLSQTIADTKGRVEKKQAQTFEELQAEREEAEAEAAMDDLGSDEEDVIYNPLKLPLGWDGKPIPYWLYKLHGLNQEFRCEICGNQSYWGRRAFEKHFKEWRHQNGMRALGIPNNKMFFEVTKIADAEALWANIQERNKGGFRAEVDEEFEDAQGNVYDKRTYELMRKQRLL